MPPRRESGIPERKLKQLRSELAGLKLIRIPTPDDPDLMPEMLRGVIATIRVNRNAVMRQQILLRPKLARLKAALVRVDHHIDASTAAFIDGRDGFHGCKNQTDRTARIKTVMLSEQYEHRACLKADILEAEAALKTAIMVKEELQAAFEEASRGLSSIDLEHKIEVTRS